MCVPVIRDQSKRAFRFSSKLTSNSSAGKPTTTTPAPKKGNNSLGSSWSNGFINSIAFKAYINKPIPITRSANLIIVSFNPLATAARALRPNSPKRSSPRITTKIPPPASNNGNNGELISSISSESKEGMAPRVLWIAGARPIPITARPANPERPLLSFVGRIFFKIDDFTGDNLAKSLPSAAVTLPTRSVNNLSKDVVEFNCFCNHDTPPFVLSFPCKRESTSLDSHFRGNDIVNITTAAINKLSIARPLIIGMLPGKACDLTMNKVTNSSPANVVNVPCGRVK